MLKQMCLATLLMLMICGMVGCSDDSKVTDSNGTPPVVSNVPTELVALWTFQSATANYNGIICDSVDLSLLLPWEENTAHARITVNNDETYIFTNVDDTGTVLLTEEGTFSADSSSFSLTGIEDLTISGNWMVSGDTLKLTATEMGYTTVLVATR